MINKVSGTSDSVRQTTSLNQTDNVAAQASFSDSLSRALEQEGLSPADSAQNQAEQFAAADVGTQSSALTTMLGKEGGLKSALLLLCMLLSSESGGGAGDALTGMVMLLAQMTGALDSDSFEELRRQIMNSGYDYQVLDQVNSEVFKSDSSSIPYEYWKPSNPEYSSDTTNRSASNYRQIIDQFNVESNGRYAVNKQGYGDTYCNIFLWDVTSAMGAEIPHYVDSLTGDIRSYPPTSGTVEMSANMTYNWLQNNGERYGWVEVDAKTAQMYANAGRPAITARYNPSGSGHVQMVCPSEDGQYSEQKGVTIAQAGSRLRNYAYISDIYSDKALSTVKYYVHL